MTESDAQDPPKSGGENEGVNEDVEGRPKDRTDHTVGAQPIGGEGQRDESTQQPAADDDVGVPPDEEMNRPT
jgi:hypothetical protein